MNKKEYFKNYYFNNKEYFKEYYIKNKERLLKDSREYHKTHKTHKTHKKYAHKFNSKFNNAYHKLCYKKNREIELLRRKIYADKKYFNGMRYFAMLRDDYKCRICGMDYLEHFKKYGSEFDIHHIDDKGFYSLNKNNDLGNLMTLCKGCHLKISHLKISILKWLTPTGLCYYNRRKPQLFTQTFNTHTNHTLSGG